MRSKLRSTALLVCFVMVAACATGPGDNPTPADLSITSSAVSAATTPIPGTATPTAEPPPGTQTATATQAAPETPTLFAGPNETLMVNNEGTSPFLVDDQGRSLYVYLNDSQDGSTSACVDDCAVDWPPLTVEAPPAAGPGVDASLVGIISRDDGSIQTTYNGWPLYYYFMDTFPGTTNAPTLNGLWYLLSPSGEPIR